MKQLFSPANRSRRPRVCENAHLRRKRGEANDILQHAYPGLLRALEVAEQRCEREIGLDHQTARRLGDFITAALTSRLLGSSSNDTPPTPSRKLLHAYMAFVARIQRGMALQ